jgi:hypothetical protein
VRNADVRFQADENRRARARPLDRLLDVRVVRGGEDGFFEHRCVWWNVDRDTRRRRPVSGGIFLGHEDGYSKTSCDGDKPSDPVEEVAKPHPVDVRSRLRIEALLYVDHHQHRVVTIDEWQRSALSSGWHFVA